MSPAPGPQPGNEPNLPLRCPSRPRTIEATPIVSPPSPSSVARASAGAPPRILLVEDSPTQAVLLEEILRDGVPGCHTHSVGSGQAFQVALEGGGPWDLCLVDLGLPDVSGFELIEQLVTTSAVPVVVVTASDSAMDAVRAMQMGAVDYVTKPVDGARLTVTVRNALRFGEQARRIDRLQADLADAFGPTRILGRSPAIESLRRLIRRAASSDVTVLISGETGTGKELVARALHYAGERADGPFLDVNSAAMTESLIESELFGHERGAFTGADRRHHGKFESAGGGTILLDEIGDMPLGTQAKILRVLQERALYRTGGNKKIDVEVRVICSTNVDLEAAVEEGAFRRDLYYRISTLVLDVPPLRERDGDVRLLAEHFLTQSSRRQKRSPMRLGPAVLDVLERHTWPGNVRELEHVLERAVLLCEGETIEVEHLPRSVTRASTGTFRTRASPNLIEAVEDLERRMILEALEAHGGVKARAARALGITPRMIGYKMLNLGIGESPAR